MSATLHPSAYRAPAWLPDGHSQTIYPALCLGGGATGLPARALGHAGWRRNHRGPPARPPGMPLLWLLHGLEGGSDSHYARALMRAAQARLAWRGQPFSRLRRRGEHPAARLPRGRLRRSGLAAGAAGQRRPAVCAVGVSLGGNMLLKHLGEAGASAPLCAAAAVSAPLDLAAAGRMLERGLARQLYTRIVLRTLRRPAWHCAPASRPD